MTQKQAFKQLEEYTIQFQLATGYVKTEYHVTV